MINRSLFYITPLVVALCVFGVSHAALIFLVWFSAACMLDVFK